MDEKEKPDSPPQPLPNDDENSRRNRIIANLKDSLSCLSLPNPTSPSPSKHAMFPPLFSSVSRRCFLLSTPRRTLLMYWELSELNENKGSTEEEISNFIIKKYEDLPWAHKKILGIQLEKLFQDEEIVCNEVGRYVLQADGDRKGRQECKRCVCYLVCALAG
ncbi:hypothetical protein S83_051072 [Arachis hypogaea]